jgi:hypothetical protein
MRTLLPPLGFAALLAAGLGWLVAAQDGGSGECPNLNKCRKAEAKERKECPRCDKAKIRADEALCATCARKEGACRICGLGKKGSEKKGGGGSTADDAFATITAADMKEFIMRFAGDEMEGRNNSSPGIQKARAFLIDHLKKAGAKPLAGTNFEMAAASSNCFNVGTLYEGSDPELKDEYVIVGSHMDHIGKQGSTINNGADDNGSGSTTNKEICEALFRSGVKTRRSIINLWFTAEEDGLVGSRDYCNSPAVPHAKVVAMLNCDMLGRNPDKAAPLYGVGSSPQFGAVVDKAMAKLPGAKVQKVMEAGPYFLRSDQVNFWRQGIPVMFITTGMHPDYHKPSDTPDKISCERMAELGKFMLFVLLEIANADARPIKDPNFKER